VEVKAMSSYNEHGMVNVYDASPSGVATEGKLWRVTPPLTWAPDAIGGHWPWMWPARSKELLPNGHRVDGQGVYQWNPRPFWWWHHDQNFVAEVWAQRTALGLPTWFPDILGKALPYDANSPAY
jgi:hypothetical protein